MVDKHECPKCGGKGKDTGRVYGDHFEPVYRCQTCRKDYHVMTQRNKCPGCGNVGVNTGEKYMLKDIYSCNTRSGICMVHEYLVYPDDDTPEKEADVDKDRCPLCGKVGVKTGDAMQCTNATCRVSNYTRYASIDVADDTPKMTDNGAMLELIHMVERVNSRLHSVDLSLEKLINTKAGYDHIYSVLRTLSKHYQRKG